MKLIVHEPTLHEPSVFRSEVVNHLAALKACADLIVANRHSPELADVAGKVYACNLFARD